MEEILETAMAVIGKRLNGGFLDWPQNLGVSEDDLNRISSHSFACFEAYFPTKEPHPFNIGML